ncbi:App1 family protein [Rathayibacter sp. CAU 1779]
MARHPRPVQRMHRAARIEDAFHAFRGRRALKRGYLPTVLSYSGYGTTEWIRVLGRVVLARDPRPGSRAERTNRKREESVRGWRSFVSVPFSDVEVTVEVDGSTHTVRPDRGGVVDTVIPVTLEPGTHWVSLRAGHTGQVATAPVQVVASEASFGVISDVDDTVMVTALPRPLLAAWNTFVVDEHARVPTPGMAVLLERLASSHPGAPMVYLSTGAWNVAPAVTRFLSRNLFPPGALLLTDWGPTHDRWFRSGREHKERSLRRLVREFPDVKWLLVGDDGQHDEAIYADFARKHPGNVTAVAIRQLSNTESVLAGAGPKAEKHTQTSGVPWVYGADGADLLAQLVALGVRV